MVSDLVLTAIHAPCIVLDMNTNGNTTVEQIMEDGGYELADKIVEWLEAHPGFFSPSRIARGIKVGVLDVYPVLDWMVAHVYVKSSGNGCWTNYAARR